MGGGPTEKPSISQCTNYVGAAPFATAFFAMQLEPDRVRLEKKPQFSRAKQQSKTAQSLAPSLQCIDF